MPSPTRRACATSSSPCWTTDTAPALEPGKLADFVVLSQDIFNLTRTPEAIIAVYDAGIVKSSATP